MTEPPFPRLLLSTMHLTTSKLLSMIRTTSVLPSRVSAHRRPRARSPRVLRTLRGPVSCRFQCAQVRLTSTALLRAKLTSTIGAARLALMSVYASTALRGVDTPTPSSLLRPRARQWWGADNHPPELLDISSTRRHTLDMSNAHATADPYTLAAQLHDIESDARRPGADLPTLRAEYRAVRNELRAAQAHLGPCTECGQPAGTCYTLCSNSQAYYSADQERQDATYTDNLSYDAWHSAAAAQYEAVHGEPYCS